MDDTCVCCGEYVPEGRQVCWGCENETFSNGLLKMELYFRNSYGEERKLKDVSTEKEISNAIGKFCKERNFKIYYIRTWEEDNATWYDVGSHTEFFIVRKK